MIGVRQTEAIFLIKDLPFMQWLFGLLMIISSSFFLFTYVLKWILVGTDPSSVYIALSLVAFILGAAVTSKAVTTVTLINKELRVITISKRSMLTSSYTQYGFADINGDLYIKEFGLLGGMLLTSSIQLPFKKDSAVLSVTGKTFFFPEILSDAVIGANKFLLRREGDTSETLSESPS